MAESSEKPGTEVDPLSNENENGWWQSWGKGWYDTIKEKSSATLELVQKDLDEFVSTIQHDTAVVVVDTANKVDEKVQPKQEEEESATKLVKTGISKLLTTVSDSLKTLTVDDEKTEDRQILLNTGTFSDKDLNAKESRIYAIQTNPETFSKDPEGAEDDFKQWKENDIDLEEKQPEMSKLLLDVPKVRAIYTELVPAKVSHAAFWQRYFYKLHQVNLEEERRAALIARVRRESGDDQLNWEDEDDNQPDSNADTKKSEDSKVNAPTALNVDNAFVAKENEAVCEAQRAETEAKSFEKLNENVAQQKSEGIVSEEGNPRDAQSASNELLENPTNKFTATSQKINATHVPSISRPDDPKQDLPQPRSDSCDSAKRPSVESVSSGSWESIDDNGLKVKTSKHPHHISTPSKSPDIAEVGSVASSGVLINREDARSEDWDDLQNDSDDLELEGDISEEELNKLVQQAKEKAKDGPSPGIDDEDDDWENWE